MKALPVLNIRQFPADWEEDFYANDFISHIKAHHQHISKPHKHDFYLTVFFSQGSGIHEIDFHVYEIKPGSVFMLNPGQTHHWEFSPNTKGFVLLHSKAFYNRVYTHKSLENFPFFYSSRQRPQLYLNAAQARNVEPWFERILQEYRSSKLLKYPLIHSLLDILYIELSRAYVQANALSLQNASDLHFDRLRQLEQLIDQNFLKKKAASDYADMMHMSTRHLNRITQAQVGKTTTELIIERVLLEAQRMLSHTHLSVAELAEYLGYEDASYFSRLFRKKLKLTPTQFAEKYRK